MNTPLPVGAGPSAPLHRAAVVGAGAAGLTTAILLRRGGVEVDLFDTRTEFTSLGSGVMLQANALRVLRDTGVWPAVRDVGHGFDSTTLRLPDARGTVVAELTEGGFDPDLPASLGVPRWELARVLREQAEQAGVRARLGTAVTALDDDDGSGVDVGLDGAGSERFDLVVGADGLGSAVRRLIGIDAVPQTMPLGVWRVIAPRPASITRAEVVNGGRAHFAGICPMSETALYAWLVEDAADRRGLDGAAQVGIVRDLAAGYHGPWDLVRESLTDATPVNYTRYSSLLLPPPWHRGRVVLVGDAVHACPPTMAQGAAQALEDAAVLSEMVLAAGRVDDDLLTAYAHRRLPRVGAVVEGSVRMAEWQLRHERGDAAELMGRTSRMLAEPA